MKLLKPFPSLVGDRSWSTKQVQGWLTFPSAGNSHRNTGARSCPQFLRAADELVVRPTPPAGSWAPLGELGERTASAPNPSYIQFYSTRKGYKMASCRFLIAGKFKDMLFSASSISMQGVFLLSPFGLKSRSFCWLFLALPTSGPVKGSGPIRETLPPASYQSRKLHTFLPSTFSFRHLKWIPRI